MNTEIEQLPLKYDQALLYVTDQLRNGHTLAQELLKKNDFKKGRFLTLLHSPADITKIHEFRTGGILAANQIETVLFHEKVYSGRKKANSFHELAFYLKNKLRPGKSCFFEDVIHFRSDPIAPELLKHVLYLLQEVYLCMEENEFSQELAGKIIHHSDAQWYYMNIISEKPSGLDKDMTTEQLQEIALRTNYIIIGAYDMEGFVVWERLF